MEPLTQSVALPFHSSCPIVRAPVAAKGVVSVAVAVWAAPLTYSVRVPVVAS